MTPRLRLFLAALLLPLVACNPSSGVIPSDDDDAVGDDDDAAPPVDCSELLVPALSWFEGSVTAALEGSLEFGQTHVVAANEERIAPPVVAEREAMLLFTPSEELDSSLDLRIGAFEGEELLGVLGLAPPEDLPTALEQDITDVALEPYSEDAWSAALPWHWMREGVELRLGHAVDDGIAVLSHTLSGLGAPHSFTVSRSKIVLFGEPDFDTTTTSAPKLAQDFFSTLPFAELRFVDSAPWHLDQLVIRTDSGPRLVSDQDERLALTNQPDRWSILKHQFALRMSLANTGRGLIKTGGSDGDNSPYSFGTSVGLGWVRNGDGSYSDVNNAPYAAGWTGWSALWQGECANVFNHEIGHSMTLLHFTGGTAVSWGIADEYPQDGIHVASHPWGFDTTRRQFRTWYRVNSSGPVGDESGLTGKRDAMNGGESSNSVTCFPQYTAYHARKVQAWAQDTPTIAELDGEPGVWQWNEAEAAYEATTADPGNGEPVAVGVPVLTLTGTLGNDDVACQTYPPIHWPSGNVFTLPDPSSEGLHSDFEGAQWFLEIGYADGSVDRALIARGTMEDTTDLALYSLNLEASREPTTVDLYRAHAAYPDLDPEAADLVHSRLIEAPTEPLSPVVRVGRGFVANGDLILDQRCSPGVDCSSRLRDSTWRVASPPLFLQDAAGTTPEPAECLEKGAVVALELPVLRDDEEEASLVLHAQRVMASSDGSVAVPLGDVTPWFEAPDTQQTLRIWMPWEDNSDLAPGAYRSAGELSILGSLDGSSFSATGIAVDLNVHELTGADVSSEFTSEGVVQTDSSVYYLVEDPAMGPTEREWWGDSGPTVLRVPVLNEDTGAVETLVLDSWKEACGDRWELNTGQGAEWACSHAVVLRVAAGGNEFLESGQSYRSPGSSPLVVTAHRWHQPNARLLLQTFAFEISYTAP